MGKQPSSESVPILTTNDFHRCSYFFAHAESVKLSSVTYSALIQCHYYNMLGHGDLTLKGNLSVFFPE